MDSTSRNSVEVISLLNHGLKPPYVDGVQIIMNSLATWSKFDLNELKTYESRERRLSADQVRAIRKSYESDYGLGKIFKLHRSVIGDIRRRVIYKDVT